MTCVAYQHYTCYHTHVGITYVDKTHSKTCGVTVAETLDYASAEAIAVAYPNNASLRVFIDQSGHCEVNAKQMRDVVITGVAFLGASAGVIFGICVLTLAIVYAHYREKRHRRLSHVELNHVSGNSVAITVI